MRIKKLLAILLCFMLILSTLPVTVLADEGNAPEITTADQKPGSETPEEEPEAPGDEEEPQPEQGEDNPQPVTYVVRFEMNGHGTALEDVMVQDGTALTEPEKPTEDRYTFEGWYSDEECVLLYDFSTPVFGDLTLYARWTEVSEEDPGPSAESPADEPESETPAEETEPQPKPEEDTQPGTYTIRFKMNDHGTELEDVTIPVDEALAEPEKPTEDGYTFEGWYSDAECTLLYDFSIPISGDLTLYAKWTEAEEPEEEPEAPEKEAETPVEEEKPQPEQGDGISEPTAEEELEEQDPVPLRSGGTPLSDHFSIEIEGSSPVFSADSFTLYANNHLETSDFSYVFTTETMVSLAIELEVYNEYSESYEEDSTDRVWVKLFLNYDLTTETVTVNTEAHGLPQEILDGNVLAGRVSVNTTIPALREAFAAIGNPHPEIFHIKLCVSSWYPDGHERAGFSIDYNELTLRDVHVPMEEFWSSIDYDSFTLTTLMTPTLNLPEGAPAIVSLSADWYTFFYTVGSIEGEDESGSFLPDPVAPVEGDGENVIEYLWPNWELEADPIPERFARYFGNGANVWIIGPENDNYAVRGPLNFIYGLAANKLSLSGTRFEDLSVSLSSFMNSSNRTYFNSLPGLSNDVWLGYYTYDEISEMEDFEGYWYDLLAMADCILTVTFSDGVVYTVDLSFIRGNEDRQFHVVGDPIEVPIVVPDYVLVVPENQEIAYGETESRLGFATLEMGEDFPENGQVVVTVTRDAGFIHMDGRPETIPFLLAGWGFEEKFLEGTLNDRTSFILSPQGLTSFPLAIYVTQDAWELAPPGWYAAKITFTSRYEVP